MNSTLCTFCPNNATNSCSCTINYCYEHQLYHDSLLGDHKIVRIKLKHRIANPMAKIKLIRKITEVKTQAKSHIQNLIQETNDFLLDFYKKLHKTIKQTNEFMKLCESVIIEIQDMNNIEEKALYTPLENALLSPNIESLLNLISPPLVEFSEKTFKISYTPSTFPHYLYNYSDSSISFIDENKIQMFPSNDIMENSKFH